MICYNANNELQSANGDVFGFDRNGNMVSKYVPGAGEVGYLWNSADKLVGVDFPDGSFARFFYRHDGLRYRRVDSDGGFMVFIQDKYTKRRDCFALLAMTGKAGGVPPLLAERRGSGAVMPGAGGIKNSPQNGETPAWLSYPPGLNAVITSSGEITYRLTDHLGSIFAITDDKGNITTQYDYDEFGIPIPPPSSGMGSAGVGSSGSFGASGNAGTAGAGLTGKPFPASTAGYTGEPQLTEPAGLVYLRQRYYDPEVGRFVSRDPIFYDSVYIYTENNPIINRDPSGLNTTHYHLEGTGDFVLVAGNWIFKPMVGVSPLIAFIARSWIISIIQAEHVLTTQTTMGSNEEVYVRAAGSWVIIAKWEYDSATCSWKPTYTPDYLMIDPWPSDWEIIINRPPVS